MTFRDFSTVFKTGASSLTWKTFTFQLVLTDLNFREMSHQLKQPESHMLIHKVTAARRLQPHQWVFCVWRWATRPEAVTSNCISSRRWQHGCRMAHCWHHSIVNYSLWWGIFLWCSVKSYLMSEFQSTAQYAMNNGKLGNTVEPLSDEMSPGTWIFWLFIQRLNHA